MEPVLGISHSNKKMLTWRGEQTKIKGITKLMSQ